MKFQKLAQAAIAAALTIVAMPAAIAQTEKADWGDFKLFLDPGHSGHENRGLWGYSEAEKVLSVALNIKDMLETYTTCADGTTLKLCRYDENTTVSLEERSDMANAWGADFYYSIHSDASGGVNTTVTLFGGWRNAGVEVEKTPNGGKAYGEILNPNLTGVMRIGTRGNWHDRCFYDRAPETHANQYPYLSVNRRSTMPSLLSEGGYHDIAEQQQRNMNADYKRLEAFAAFQSILGYRGMELPAQSFATGMIYNSENQQPINGAKVTIDGKTYTTDTYESLFNKYSRNPELIHNGFFIFEGLTPGQEYTYEVKADGFETVSGTFTAAAGGATTPAYVAFLDQAMTNIMPAKVTGVSADDLSSVPGRDPLKITFSRNMDRTTVEEAFAINQNGQVELSWKNDYTLLVDISKLMPYITYTITIDGNVARNTQTNALLDGDGDGEPGGDYKLTFTMAEPDTEAPYVVATFPADGSEALYTRRPPIRIEFNEEIAFNGDKNDGCITVKDALGKEYAGELTHDVVRGRSVLHFYSKEDFAGDAAILVSFAGGIADLNDNVGEPYHFRFLTEYRARTAYEEIHPLSGKGSLWAPGGSGSTSGCIIDESTSDTFNCGPSLDDRTSFVINYVFDEMAADGTNFFIRNYDPSYNNVASRHNNMNGYLTMWVYGDGSNNGAMAIFRTSKGVTYCRPLTLDFIGWNLLVIDMQTAVLTPVSAGTSFTEADWYLFDAVGLTHQRIEEDEEDEEGNPIPFQEWTGSVGYNSLDFSAWDPDAQREARIEDVELPSGIIGINADSNAPVEFFNLQGIRVDNPAQGVYIRRQGSTADKVVVK